MAELLLKIKPEFDKKATEDFAKDIHDKISNGGGGSFGGSNDSLKESKKQTGLLESLSGVLTGGFLRLGLVGATAVAGAKAVETVNDNLKPKSRQFLYDAFSSGENTSDEIANALINGLDIRGKISLSDLTKEYADASDLMKQALDTGNFEMASNIAEQMKALEEAYDLIKPEGVAENLRDFYDQQLAIVKLVNDRQSELEQQNKLKEAFGGGTKPFGSEVVQPLSGNEIFNTVSGPETAPGNLIESMDLWVSAMADSVTPSTEDLKKTQATLNDETKSSAELFDNLRNKNLDGSPISKSTTALTAAFGALRDMINNAKSAYEDFERTRSKFSDDYSGDAI